MLTLAIFWVGLAWLLVEPIGMFGLAPLLAKFGVKGYTILIVGGLILGAIHHIVKLNRGKDPYKLIVFETINQKSELRAKPSGLELFLYDFNDNTNQGSKWTIPTNQLQDILDRGNIFIRRSRRQSERGLFDLGGHRNWYYSTIYLKPLEIYRKN